MRIGWHRKKAIVACNLGQGAYGYPQRSAQTFSRKIRSTPQGFAWNDRESFDEFSEFFGGGICVWWVPWHQQQGIAAVWHAFARV